MAENRLSIQPVPGFRLLLKVLRRDGMPDRVPSYELLFNIIFDVLEAIGQPWEPAVMDPDESGIHEWRLRRRIAYMYALGYDYATAGATKFSFPRKERPTAMTAHGERAYFPGDHRTIANRGDFDKYTWPVVSEVDYSLLENSEDMLPEGMMFIGGCPGILENVTWLLGYNGISYLINDDL